MKLSDEQIKLLNELKIRYDCVRVDIAVDPQTKHLSNTTYGAVIDKRMREERNFFAQKHSISVEELIQMETAYNQLQDLSEYHIYLDYHMVCDTKFYVKLRSIIENQVWSVGSLGKSFVPEILQNGYQRGKNEIDKRLNRCRKALEKVIPHMSLYDYENIEHSLQYRLDHGKMEEKDYEDEMIIRLCNHAITEDYFSSRWKQFVKRLMDMFR